MTPREKVSDMLTVALKAEGFSMFSAQTIYDNIWTPQGGERGLDIARWDIDLHCELDGQRVTIHVHSWATLTDISKQKTIKLVAHSWREFEAQ